MIELRPYQSAMIAEARELMRQGVRCPLLVAPTGGGKRLMAIYTIKRAVQRGKRCWLLVHRRELLDQAARTLDEAGLPFGVIQSGVRPDYRQQAQLASVQTLTRRIRGIPAPDFIFVDEAHHARAATWEALLAAFPQAFILGFTATPVRQDGRALGPRFDRIVTGPSMRWLIDQGYLADYRLFAPPGTDVSAIRTMAGDYRSDELAEVVDRPQIVGDVVTHYQRLAPSSQAICFGVNIRHSEHLAEAFATAGISARHLAGTTDRRTRSLILEDFAAGRFRVLCNVDILGEGLDVAGIETVICARPTQSLAVYLQQIGRGLRVKPNGRPATILDHAGNSLRHGLPDEDRAWTLEDEATKRKRPSGQGIKICPSCFAALAPQRVVCSECGFIFRTEPVMPDHAKGELIEISAMVARREARVEQGRAKTMDELIALGRSRGYRRPEAWATHILSWRRRGLRA